MLAEKQKSRGKADRSFCVFWGLSAKKHFSGAKNLIFCALSPSPFRYMRLITAISVAVVVTATTGSAQPSSKAHLSAAGSKRPVLLASAGSWGSTQKALVSVTSVEERDRLNKWSPKETNSVVRKRASQNRVAGKKAGKAKREPQVAAKPVHFYRVSTGQHIKIALTNKHGGLRPSARQKLAALMRPRNSKKIKLPHPRLIKLLADVAKFAEYRPIHIISGYRKAGGHTHKTSRHTLGRAMDFRIPGVSNVKLRDFCRRFHDVGVGYYPRSTFVHLDVRDKNAYWVDTSRPGEAPSYKRHEEWMDKSGHRIKDSGELLNKGQDPDASELEDDFEEPKENDHASDPKMPVEAGDDLAAELDLN